MRGFSTFAGPGFSCTAVPWTVAVETCVAGDGDDAVVVGAGAGVAVAGVAGVEDELAVLPVGPAADAGAREASCGAGVMPAEAGAGVTVAAAGRAGAADDGCAVLGWSARVRKNFGPSMAAATSTANVRTDPSAM